MGRRRLLNLEPEDSVVAAAVIIPPEELNGKDEEPTPLQ
jgi:hypothetical protein